MRWRRTFFVNARTCYRSFSNSPTASVPVRAPSSLRTRRAPVPAGSTISIRPGWPTNILEAASQSGLLSVSVTTAVQILEAFEERRSLSTEQLCTKYNVKPNVLTILAQLLQRSEHHRTAADLLLASARLGDDEAILRVIKQAVERGDLSDPRVSLIYQQLFQPMVQRNHPAALYLEGRKSEGEGLQERALEFYERTITTDALLFDSTGKISAADIWKAIGKLKAKRKDRKGAEAAFRTAAFEYDDPSALYQLAKAFVSPSSAEFESYMLKAAASGEAKAAHELGLLYFNRSRNNVPTAEQIHPPGSSKRDEVRLNDHIQQQRSKSTKVVARDRDGAQEWFHIGAESGIFKSQVYLALLLRDSGKAEDGFNWLALARNPDNLSPKALTAWTRAIAYLSAHWDDTEFNLNRLDVERTLEGRIAESTDG